MTFNFDNTGGNEMLECKMCNEMVEAENFANHVAGHMYAKKHEVLDAFDKLLENFASVIDDDMRREMRDKLFVCRCVCCGREADDI